METNLILDRLPNMVKTKDGSLFSINTDFRTSIQFELCMGDTQLTEQQKAGCMLSLYYGNLSAKDVLAHFDELTEYAIYFYSGGKRRRKRNAEDKASKMVYSFEYDDNLIWAAFWNCGMGINLRSIPYLHWWDFQAALWSLPSDCAFMRAVEIRSIDLSEFKGKERAYYTQLQQDYAFPEQRSVEQKISKVEAILMGNGDLSREEWAHG